jgi:hypothetical protein
MSTTEEQTSTMRSSEMDEESPVDLSLLRELGKNSLVNVLNSVRLSRSPSTRSVSDHLL